jgi:hypothetical protein
VVPATYSLCVIRSVKRGHGFLCPSRDCWSSQCIYNSRMAVRAHALHSHKLIIGCHSGDYTREKRCILITGPRKVGKTFAVQKIATMLMTSRAPKRYWELFGFKGVTIGDVTLIQDGGEDNNNNNNGGKSPGRVSKLTLKNILSLFPRLQSSTLLMECGPSLYHPDCIRKMPSHNADFLIFNLNATAGVLEFRRKGNQAFAEVMLIGFVVITDHRPMFPLL